jgi:uncharacterized membrane protein YkvA (DUF1232 family)
VPTPESQFVDLVRTWLVSLPHDLKIAFEAMDDENLSRADRELAVGTIVYIVSPSDSATDRSEAVVSFADDTLLLRLALRRFARKKDDEDTQAFVERFPELFDNLDRDLDLCARMMGDLFNWLGPRSTVCPRLPTRARRSSCSSTTTRPARTCSRSAWPSAPTTRSTSGRWATS